MGPIDTHVHVWSLTSPEVRWPTPDWPSIHRDFSVDDLYAEADLSGVILVQSQPDDRDTDRLLALAAEDDRVLGVVGWADLAHPDAVGRLADLAARPKLVGLRPMLQAEPDTDWILRPAVQPALTAMAALGLTFDALIQPRHLRATASLADRHPDLRIVVNHGAKPAIARGEFPDWASGIDDLAGRPNVFAKLSGLALQQSRGAPLAELRPWVGHLAGGFGDRLMWGSDWPVLRAADVSHKDWEVACRDFAAELRLDPETLFQGAAVAAYRLTL